jgi:predicted metalloprotease
VGVVGGVSWGGSKYLMQKKSEERYVVIEVHPEGFTHGPCSDIQRYVKFGFNRLDFRNLWIGH